MDQQLFSSCGKWDHDYQGGVCLKGCGVPQVATKIEVHKDYWADYLRGFDSRPRPKTYVEEMVLPEIHKFNWTNDTLEKDLSLFWMACYRLWKEKPTIFKEVLLWASSNKIHPRAWFKTVTKRCTTKKEISSPSPN